MIEKAQTSDVEEILSVINTTNRKAYKNIIPREQFKEPILTRKELLQILDINPSGTESCRKGS